MFLTVLHFFSPFFPRANRSGCSYKRVTMSAIRSCRSLQKSDGSDLPLEKFLRANRNFTHKKRAVRLKNQRANSQPCCKLSRKKKKYISNEEFRNSCRAGSKILIKMLINGFRALHVVQVTHLMFLFSITVKNILS